MAQLAAISLDDKYTLEEGRVYLTGIQALVRLPLMQRQLDARAGLNTAGCISGYRGSPLGGLDQQLWRAKKFLTRQQIEFQAGVNEDLAATVVWGSQQVNMYKDAAQAMFSNTPTMPVRQNMAVFWFWPVMTIPANHPPCPIRPNMPLSMRKSRF
jgi:hypothetical protein